MALKCSELGMTVFACCFGLETPGEQKLRELNPDSKNFFLVDLDVTKSQSIQQVHSVVELFLENNPQIGDKKLSFIPLWNFKFSNKLFQNQSRWSTIVRSCVLEKRNGKQILLLNSKFW
jgi:hypothetical protein